MYLYIFTYTYTHTYIYIYVYACVCMYMYTYHLPMHSNELLRLMMHAKFVSPPPDAGTSTGVDQGPSVLFAKDIRVESGDLGLALHC